jgi:hypothetical protein
MPLATLPIAPASVPSTSTATAPAAEPWRHTVRAGTRVTGVTYFPPPDGKAWPHVSKWAWDHWTHWLTLSGWTPPQIAQYQRDRDHYGVGIPTTDRRGKVDPRGEVRWLYRPTPKQVLLHNATAPNVLWGGAAGGSKSTGLRWDAYKRCLSLPGYRVLLMRRLATELFEHHLDLAKREVEAFQARVVENEIRFPNGSLIRGGHCQHPGDELRFLSIEYDCIDIDELATLEQSQANEIISRARTTKEGVTAMVRCTSNPGGAHTLYVVDRWITKTINQEDDPFYDPRDYCYIPARLYDNPYLMDPDGTFTTYEKRLGPLPPQRRDQLLNGDWSAISGQFFPEFRDRDIGQGGHIRRIELPPTTKMVRAIDWGYNAPGCCLWLALLPDSHVHVCHEYRFQQTLAAEVAEKIQRETEQFQWKAHYSVMDPSAFAKTGHIGESVAETFAKAHVPCQPGDNARTLGWQRLRHWFATAPDGLPWLTIDPGCRYLRRTLPGLVSDAREPEDVNTEGDDHAADALRYGVMSRPSPSRSPLPQKFQPGTIGHLKQIAKRRKDGSSSWRRRAAR